MAGTGPAPAEQRRRANEPERGDWKSLQLEGWQHEPVPACPVRGRFAAETWTTWMRSWVAAHWGPADLPNLRLAIACWSKIQSGAASREEHALYLRLADDLGLTRKGQQDRRWQQPVLAEGQERPHLRVMGSRRDA